MDAEGDHRRVCPRMRAETFPNAINIGVLDMPVSKTLIVAAISAIAGSASAQWTAASGRIYYASGNVGIGTASNPVGRLDVRSNGTRTISAFNNATTGYNYAVHGTSLSNNGRGVYGIAQNVQGNGSGVFGVSNGYIGRGVYGFATDNRDGASYGVYGKANSSGGAGIYGQNTHANGYAGYFVGGRNYFEGNIGVGTTISDAMVTIGNVGGLNGVEMLGFGEGATSEFYFGSIFAPTGSNNAVTFSSSISGQRDIMTWEAGGNVGIGTSDPAYTLDVAGDMKLRTGDNLYFGAVGENTDTVYIERINNSTNGTFLDVVIGDDPSSSLDYFRIRNSASANQTFWFASDGVAYKTGGGSWANSSDRRIKRDIKTLSGSLDRLLQLRGVHFYYTNLTAPGTSPGLKTGFVAQEVESIFPEWITKIPGTDTHEDLKGLSISGFEALTVEALRELRAEQDAEIASVRSEKDEQIASLRADNDELRDRMARLEALVEQMANR